MYAIANSPTQLYSSAGMVLSPYLTPCNFDPSLKLRTEPRTVSAKHRVPYFPAANDPFPNHPSKGNVARGVDLVKTHVFSEFSTHFVLNPPQLTSRGRGVDVTDLPVEIICEIFERFIEDDSLRPIYHDSPGPLTSASCRSDPTVLGQICSRWRNVAIHLPKLWSNILIYNPKQSQVHLTSVWLQRSGTAPLNLKITFNKGDKNLVDVVAAAQILASFITHLECWKKIDFQLPLDLLGPLYAVISSPQQPLKLESVSFAFCDAVRYGHKAPRAYFDAIWKFFHTGPSLRQVVWSGDEVDYTFPKHAPFQQLTHVHARFLVALDDILSFLAQVPLIQELWVEDLRLPSKDSIVTVSPPLLLQHLRILKVYSNGVRTGSLFANLTCASLQSLETKHHYLPCYASQDFLEIPQLLKRSKCRLLHLTIGNAHISDEDLKQCLSESALQSLTSLNLCTDHISDEIVTFLASQSVGGMHEFAPFLEKLDLYPAETSDGLLAQMVSSRWHEVLNGNYSTSVGHLREAAIFPMNDFGPIDEAFFSANVLY